MDWLEFESRMKHSVQHIRNTQLPPKRDDVIGQTLKISQQVAADCGDEFPSVTYDLNCAKIARNIKN